MSLQLPPDTYLQSYLKRAGIRFDVNVVDAAAAGRFGPIFYVILMLFMLLCIYGVPGLNQHLLSGLILRSLLMLLCLSYLGLSIGRCLFFLRLRNKLRQDKAPIVCEAYSAVILDDEKRLIKWPRRFKAAIVYKECGTCKPRFFLSAAVRGTQPKFMSGQMARVFIDRHNARWYSVDDSAMYQPAERLIPKTQAKLDLSGTPCLKPDANLPAATLRNKGEL